MNDPYTSLRKCRTRLNDEYKKHGKIIVAYDFDGTVYDFHNEGHKFPRAIDLIQRVRPYAHIAFLSLLWYVVDREMKGRD